MNQVSEILEGKGHEVLEIDADASVHEAVERMVAANVGSLLALLLEKPAHAVLELGGRTGLHVGHHAGRDAVVERQRVEFVEQPFRQREPPTRTTPLLSDPSRLPFSR